MNEIIFTKDAFDQYRTWISEDRKTIRKINDLLEDIRRNGALQGIGKPEVLKYRPGFSRRIDEKNRLIYDIDGENNVRVLACRGHYEA